MYISNIDLLLNNINNLIKEKNMTKSQFYKDIGISSGSFGDWKSGKSKPSEKTLKKLSVYFNCTVEELINNFEKKSINLSVEEKNLIMSFRKFNNNGKKKAREKIEELSKISKYTLENDNLNEELSITTDSPVVNIEDFKKIKFYNTPVSAGKGSFISDYEDYEIVNIDLKLVPQARRCDFALRVRGDSMQPNYYDGDTVFIREQPSLDNGQIGIFIYEEEAYIKKYVMNENGVYLFSLNKKYPPIKIEEYSSFKICGIVL